MIVTLEGLLEGTIGGGEMESRVIAEVQEAIRAGTPRLVRHALVDPQSGDPGVCGGEVEIFVEPIQPLPEHFRRHRPTSTRAPASGSWRGLRATWRQSWRHGWALRPTTCS